MANTSDRFENLFKCDYRSHRVLKFNMLAIDEKIDGERIQFDYKTAWSLEANHRLIIINQTVSAFQADDGRMVPIAELQTSASFGFEDLNSKLEGGDGPPTLRPYFYSLLAGLSLATNRGILLTKTAGTELSMIPIPVIDPYKLVGLDKQPILEIKESAPTETIQTTA
jgi:hypothetical protein